MQALSARSPRQSVHDYFIALLIFTAAVAVRVLLDQIIPDQLPFVTFFPAVILAAFFCGLAPAILVTGRENSSQPRRLEWFHKSASAIR